MIMEVKSKQSSPKMLNAAPMIESIAYKIQYSKLSVSCRKYLPLLRRLRKRETNLICDASSKINDQCVIICRKKKKTEVDWLLPRTYFPL